MNFHCIKEFSTEVCQNLCTTTNILLDLTCGNLHGILGRTDLVNNDYIMFINFLNTVVPNEKFLFCLHFAIKCFWTSEHWVLV